MRDLGSTAHTTILLKLSGFNACLAMPDIQPPQSAGTRALDYHKTQANMMFH
jgi:hypothetical protein